MPESIHILNKLEFIYFVTLWAFAMMVYRASYMCACICVYVYHSIHISRYRYIYRYISVWTCICMYVYVCRCIHALCNKTKEKEIVHPPTPAWPASRLMWVWTKRPHNHEHARDCQQKKNEVTKHFLFFEWRRMIQKILEGSSIPAKNINVSRIPRRNSLLEREVSSSLD